MRLFIVGVALLLSVSTSAAAQSRWTVSAGPEWTWSRSHLWGLRLRADYDLIGQRSPLRFQLQAGARWGPTQGFYNSFQLADGSSASYGGSDQTVDLTFGVVAAITPVPRARVAPYVTLGVLARQAWSNGWTQWTGSPFIGGTGRTPERLRAIGSIIAVPGLGARVRVAQRTFQFEYRWLDTHHSATFGTTLPFE